MATEIDYEEGAPDYLLCPLTHALMEDPVIVLGSGRTYERAAIERWVQTKHTEPFTRLPVPLEAVVQNVAIRERVAAWRARRLREEADRHGWVRWRDNPAAVAAAREAARRLMPGGLLSPEQAAQVDAVFDTVWATRDWVDAGVPPEPLGKAVERAAWLSAAAAGQRKVYYDECAQVLRWGDRFDRLGLLSGQEKRWAQEAYWAAAAAEVEPPPAAATTPAVAHRAAEARLERAVEEFRRRMYEGVPPIPEWRYAEIRRERAERLRVLPLNLLPS